MEIVDTDVMPLPKMSDPVVHADLALSPAAREATERFYAVLNAIGWKYCSLCKRCWPSIKVHKTKGTCEKCNRSVAGKWTASNSINPGALFVPIVAMKSGVVKHGHYLEREKLPTIVAWAITIHKSQSLSLDTVVISFGKKEESPGLSYVGMSRGKTTAGLALDALFSLRRLQRVGGGVARFRADAQARASMTLSEPEPDEYFVHS
jgi:hypothetical protein